MDSAICRLSAVFVADLKAKALAGLHDVTLFRLFDSSPRVGKEWMGEVAWAKLNKSV